jgi:hypothetical protein
MIDMAAMPAVTRLCPAVRVELAAISTAFEPDVMTGRLPDWTQRRALPAHRCHPHDLEHLRIPAADSRSLSPRSEGSIGYRRRDTRYSHQRRMVRHPNRSGD